MASNLNYDLLWQFVQKERQTNELQPLPKTFYDDMRTALSTTEDKNLTEDEINTKKNALRLMSEIYERRKQKILIYVAYKKQLPQPAIQAEQQFYNTLIETTNNNKLDMQRPKEGGKQTLQTLQALPEIILPSGKKIGPLEKDQTVVIDADEEDIKFLVSNTICKKV